MTNLILAHPIIFILSGVIVSWVLISLFGEIIEAINQSRPWKIRRP